MESTCPVGMRVVDASGNVQEWSPEAALLFGWTVEEMIGKPAPEAIQDAYMKLAPILHKQGQLNHTLNCLKRGGGSIEIRLRFAALKGTLANQTGYMALFWDSSAERTAEAEKRKLIESERAALAAAKAESRFRELLEVAADSNIEVDRHGSIVLCNAATERLFGYRREELLGSPVEMLIPEGNRGMHQKHRAAYWENP
jgi:PAS domain S-box-containing protein